MGNKLCCCRYKMYEEKYNHKYYGKINYIPEEEKPFIDNIPVPIKKININGELISFIYL